MPPTIVRTTCFRLPPETLGRVYAYRDTERLRDAWARLEERFRASAPRTGRDSRRLPYRGLATALRILSGDFVRIRPTPRDPSRDHYFLVSRRPLNKSLLEAAFLAWETAVLPEAAGELSALVASELEELPLEIGGFIGRRAGSCPVPEPWVWDAALWEVAYTLAARPLVVEGGRSIPLRLDTDASLLTWNDLVSAERKGTQHHALHRIAPKLITLPGFEDPVIHLESSVVRLSNDWGYKVRSAWMDRGPRAPILRLRVRRVQGPDGWIAAWGDGTPDLLRGLELAELADPQSIALTNTASVRARLMHAPAGHPLATGPGQMFHDAVAMHARDALTRATPVVLEKARSTLKRPISGDVVGTSELDGAIRAAGHETFRLVGLYATPETRSRLVAALSTVLGPPAQAVLAGAADGEVRRHGLLEVVFQSPPDARARLLHGGTSSTTRAWALETTTPHLGVAGRGAGFLIETSSEEQRGEGGEDPKFVIRRLVAERGSVCQFISRSSEPRLRKGEEPHQHAGVRAIWDLFRSAGIFPRPFPAGGVPSGTWLVGVHAVKRQNQTNVNAGFVMALVAIEAGSGVALGLSRSRQWVPLGAATSDFLAIDHNLTSRAATDLVESALECLIARDTTRQCVIFMDATECRRLWNGLADTRGDVFPASMRSGRIGLVRVRTTSQEVPRPAGKGDWPTGPGPGKPRTLTGLLRLRNEEWAGAYFYASTPRAMGAMGAHRRATRYGVTGRDLADNWQALNLTELLCLYWFGVNETVGGGR